jgi:hypothetical protein
MMIVCALGRRLPQRYIAEPQVRLGFLGQNSVRIGSIRRHNSSGISQIVPGGSRRTLRRLMVVAPGAAFGDSLVRYNLLHARGVPPILG